MSAFPRPESVELLQPTGTTQTARLPGLGEASLAEFRQAMAVESSQTNCLAAGFPDAQFCSVAPDRLGHQPAPEIAPLPVSPIGYTMWHHGNTGVGSAATADADLYSATRFGRRSDSVGDQFVSTALAASTLSNLEALALAQAGPPAINNRDTNDGTGTQYEQAQEEASRSIAVMKAASGTALTDALGCAAAQMATASGTVG